MVPFILLIMLFVMWLAYYIVFNTSDFRFYTQIFCRDQYKVAKYIIKHNSDIFFIKETSEAEKYRCRKYTICRFNNREVAIFDNRDHIVFCSFHKYYSDIISELLDTVSK